MERDAEICDVQSEESPLLAVADLSVEFATQRGTIAAVRGVTYGVSRGESVGLVGESGSGKSVSALAVLGLLPARTARVSGSARFKDRELVGLTERTFRAIRGSGIGIVFQDSLSSLNPVLSIGRQLTEHLEAHMGMSRRDARERAKQLLELVGIPDPAQRLRQFPHELSGGMRQRAMIAIALACDPPLLIADEPTTALDVTIQAQVLDLLAHLRSSRDMSLLLITHDLGVVAGCTDRLIVMYAGQIVETGPTEEILAHPSHPYTVGLLDAVPRLDRPREARLVPIIGAPPDVASLAPGCPFTPRCPHALTRCGAEDPPLETVAPGREVACWAPRFAEPGLRR